MGEQSECGGRARIEKTPGQHRVACASRAADPRGPLSASESGVDPYTRLGESELGATGADPVVAREGEFETTSESETGSQSDSRLGAALKLVQDGVPVGGEVVDLLERVGADLVDEELHIRAGDEGLASTF